MLLLLGCGSFGLTSLVGGDTTGLVSAPGDTGGRSADGDSAESDADEGDSWSPDDSAAASDSGGAESRTECGELMVTWQPSVSADYAFYIEYTEEDGDIAVPWVLVDAGTGLPELGTDLTVCGGSLRFIGAGDRDADGADDVWSAMVSGDGCVEVGEVNCTWNGAPIDDSTVRRSDGCSNTCEVP